MEQPERLWALDLQHPHRNMQNMGKIGDILVKCSYTVTEKPTLKLPKPKNIMQSAAFASFHIYYICEATEAADGHPQLQKSSYVPGE